jgi:uncharacterized peroxidase-related enzyme
MSPELRTAWIYVRPPDAAPAELAPVYEAIRSSRGKINHFWQSQSLAPEALAAHHALYAALWNDLAPLTPAQGELIAVVVTALNGAAYCVAHHGPRLAEALRNEGLARAVAKDYRTANLPARDRVLLDHVVALTCEPSERTEADLERLREYGYDDTAILKATLLASYYNLVSRIATVLGVALESGRERWEFGSQK